MFTVQVYNIISQNWETVYESRILDNALTVRNQLRAASPRLSTARVLGAEEKALFDFLARPAKNQ